MRVCSTLFWIQPLDASMNHTSIMGNSVLPTSTSPSTTYPSLKTTPGISTTSTNPTDGSPNSTTIMPLTNSTVSPTSFNKSPNTTTSTVPTTNTTILAVIPTTNSPKKNTGNWVIPLSLVILLVLIVIIILLYNKHVKHSVYTLRSKGIARSTKKKDPRANLWNGVNMGTANYEDIAEEDADTLRRVSSLRSLCSYSEIQQLVEQGWTEDFGKSDVEKGTSTGVTKDADRPQRAGSSKKGFAKRAENDIEERKRGEEGQTKRENRDSEMEKQKEREEAGGEDCSESAHEREDEENKKHHQSNEKSMEEAKDDKAWKTDNKNGNNNNDVINGPAASFIYGKPSLYCIQDRLVRSEQPSDFVNIYSH
uniref:Uncharacterized protein n=1 Tax=Eptatretus burgeri TaxID=7764 RepID=A0A8C4QWU2_EPTBU